MDWFAHFTKLMMLLNLEPTKSDVGMFVCRMRQVYVIAHVDDVHGTEPEKELKEVIAEMSKHIMIKMEPMLVQEEKDPS